MSGKHRFRTHRPEVHSDTIDDFENFRALFGDWDGEFMQLSRGEFRGRFVVAQGRLLRGFHAELNQSLLTRGADTAGLVSFIPVTKRNAATTWQGRELAPGQMIVKSAAVQYHNRTRRDTVIQALLVPETVLQEALHTLTGRDPLELVPSWAAIRPSNELFGCINACIEQVLGMASASGSLSGMVQGQRFEAECLQHLCDALLPPGESDGERLALPQRVKLVRRAEEIIDAHLDGSLTAWTLCDALGVSDRTLRRAFNDCHGRGPLSYCRLRRFHGVRADLKAAAKADTLVAEIARRWGFHRLGAFANDYLEHFGEYPSQTLKRRNG
jgi:AraC family ethanolamine operon transcriptional activator